MTYGFDYDFAMPSLGEGLAAGALGVVVAVVLIFALVLLALSLVSYVLGALGLYRIAKRRGIHHAWLAWIPVGASWLLGSVSDHYQYVAKHKVTKRRKVLLALSILAVCVSVGEVIVAVISELVAGTIGLSLVLGLFYVLMMGISIAAMVFCYIAYYDLFASCRPGSAVLFLVLGIFFSCTLPFFVFACSGSDQGMPPRRERRPAPQIPYEPEQAPVQEQIPVVETEIVDDTFEE